ncbi:MAG: hypothetical protein AMXMBFR64_49570 [Myxococcales bacterium]
MQTHSLVSALLILGAVGFGLGRLIAVSTGSSEAPAATSTAPQAVALPQPPPMIAPPSPQAAPQVQAPQAAPQVQAPQVPAPAQPAAAAQLGAPPQVAAAQPPPPRVEAPPAISAFPKEPGVPDLPAGPLPNAKPHPLPGAPKGWLPSPALGSDEGKVTVVVASDFQCPVCRRVVEPVEALVHEVPEVRIEFKQHPLSSHRRAEPAAVASMAAHKQGRFWEYHNLLFQNQAALEDADLERYAQQLSLDMDRFRKDLQDPALLAQARAESKASELLGARGTPAFFINGKLQVGWGSYFGFKQMVVDELAAANAAVKAGTPPTKAYEARVLANHESGPDYVKYFIQGTPPAEAASP